MRGHKLLEAERCVLVAIDLQEKLVPPIFEKERVIKNTALLLHLARILKLPVLLTTQYRKGLGPVIPEISSLAPECEPIDKASFSCLGEESFARRLESLSGRRDTLLVAGIESHICVAQTVLAALERGYNVHVASDAVSSRSEHNWKIGLARMEKAGATISSTEMMLYELLGRSGTDEFKAILPLLK